jgi:uncharacterized protein (DUF2267 family)
VSATGLDVFDTTLQKTNDWLNDLMQRQGWTRPRAYRALRATLHALRDRLIVEEVAELAAQLPMLIRGFYYEGWDPTGSPVKARRKEQFLAHIAQEMQLREASHGSSPTRASRPWPSRVTGPTPIASTVTCVA